MCMLVVGVVVWSVGGKRKRWAQRPDPKYTRDSTVVGELQFRRGGTGAHEARHNIGEDQMKGKAQAGHSGSCL